MFFFEYAKYVYLFWRPLILFVAYLIKDISAVAIATTISKLQSILGNLIYEGQHRVLKQYTSIIMMIWKKRKRKKNEKYLIFVTNDSRDDLFCLNRN